MSKHFMGSKNKITVGVTFDETWPALQQALALLSERTGMKATYVHAVEPPPRLPFHGVRRDSENEGLIDQIHQAFEAASCLQAEARLRELTNGEESEFHVVVGNPADALRSQATMSHASLIMIGKKEALHQWTPRGLSTALQLANRSPAPVLIAPVSGNSLKDKSRLKMLIADDLAEATQQAVLAGHDLARALGNTDILHLHVSNLSEEKIKNWVQHSAGGAVSEEEALTSAVSLRRNYEKELGQRAPERLPLIEARNCSYQSLVTSGDPVDEIKRVAAEFEPDILVFGQHHGIHRKTFSIGKMPFYAMLRLNKLVMIVPDQYGT